MRQWWAPGRIKDLKSIQEERQRPRRLSWSWLANRRQCHGPKQTRRRFWGAEGVDGFFGMIRQGELPKVSTAKRGGAWGRREGVWAHPSQCLTEEVHGLRVAGGWGRMVMMGRKGGATIPPKTTPWDEMLAFFDVGSEEAVEGSDSWLKRSRTYQAWEVQEPVICF